MIYDAHDKNSSRRYKAFGSFYGKETATSGLCRGQGSKTPKTAANGDFWPPCHNLGVAYSSDGIHFTNAVDESNSKNDIPALDVVGQNDGALDLAIYDPDLDGGSYWGLVRLDVVGPPNPTPWGGAQGFRRTGRFTSKDFVRFTPGEQVFHGRQGYEIYTIQPFRLQSYRPGYYLATAMFYNTSSAEGFVNCELLQTTDWGQNWTRVASEGTQFIPRGNLGQFDSHTLYTAWHGDGNAFVDPQDSHQILYYYAGGNGPHSGQRDDSIGLARGQIHAYAGLQSIGKTRKKLHTSQLVLSACANDHSQVASIHAHTPMVRLLSILAAGDDGSDVAVMVIGNANPLRRAVQQTRRDRGLAAASWIDFEFGCNASTMGSSHAVELGIRAERATLFAIQVTCVPRR